MATLGDLSWLAGILDIKGRFSSTRTSISITTPSQGLALAVADMLGVAAVESRGTAYDRKGCATHCPHEHVHVEQTRPSYTVRVTGIGAVIVAGGIHTRLRAQASEAQALVQSYLLGTRPNSGMVTHVVDRMARLGWDVPEWAR